MQKSMNYKDFIKKEGEFEYLEIGEGRTLVVLHGLFGALSNFSDLINDFSGKYKIVVPIMPLYSLPLLETGVKTLSKYIDRFMEYKNYNDVILLGNSLGGHVAMVYYLSNPNRIHSMILTGSSGLYENAFGGSFPRREDKEYLRKKVAVTFYDPAMVTDELLEEVHEIIKDRNKLIRVLAIAKSAIRHNLSNEIEKIKVPTCLIWGKDDKITPPEVAEDFHRLLPDSELFWIDKCAHAPMMERPTEFNAILKAWLSKRFGF